MWVTYRVSCSSEEKYWNPSEIKLTNKGTPVKIDPKSCSSSSVHRDFSGDNSLCQRLFDSNEKTYWAPKDSERNTCWIEFKAGPADSISFYQHAHLRNSATLTINGGNPQNLLLNGKRTQNIKFDMWWAPKSKAELKAAIHACHDANDFACSKGPKGPIGSWDVSRVTDFYQLFWKAYSFNGDISKWDVSRVTNMKSLFNVCRLFNSDLSKWDVSRVTTMYATFYYAEAFTGDISKWDVSNVENFYAVFGHTPSFSQVLCGEWKKNPKSNNAYNDNGRWFENSSGKLC